MRAGARKVPCLTGLLRTPAPLLSMAALRRKGRQTGALLALPGLGHLLHLRLDCTSAWRQTLCSAHSVALPVLP